MNFNDNLSKVSGLLQKACRNYYDHALKGVGGKSIEGFCLFCAGGFESIGIAYPKDMKMNTLLAVEWSSISEYHELFDELWTLIFAMSEAYCFEEFEDLNVDQFETVDEYGDYFYSKVCLEFESALKILVSENFFNQKEFSSDCFLSIQWASPTESTCILSLRSVKKLNSELVYRRFEKELREQY